MWLTLATFVGYAIIYTVLLKPATPQNIVIGGASGAMPPVLGWAAVRDEVAPEALILFLIIFAWTPPHFWALALYRTRGYARAGLPMLPVTHGAQVHAAACRALHGDPLRRDAAAVRDPDERLALPRRGGRARRRVPRATRSASMSTTATRSRARRSATRSSTSRRCSRRCWSITICIGCAAAARARLVAAALLAGCVRPASPRSRASTSPARLRARVRAHRSHRQAAHARRFPRQGRWWCSSASRSARTCARPRSPS